MLKKSTFPSLITCILLYTSCKKAEERPIHRPLLEEIQFKFQVVEINYHCKDYYGRKVARLKCVKFPDGLEYYYKARYNGNYFYTTSLPGEFQEKGKEFVGEVQEYVDWPERAGCQIYGSQINIANIDYAD